MESKIIISDYEVVACHGVNPEEKINPQRFLVSCELYTDVTAAAETDDLNRTVSYSAVCKRLKSFFSENCFNLIETLAGRFCKLLLVENPSLTKASVTVKKPDAPMKAVFDYVAVSAELCWHKAYLSLGSNLGDRNGYLDFAISELKKDANIKDVKESRRHETLPYGGVAHEVFVNSAAELFTLYTPQELLSTLNAIEYAGGRKREERWGNRTLDLDIIFYDDQVAGDANLCIPHVDMHNREFVLAPLAELCPNYLHPVLKKRVTELLSAITLISK